MKANYFKLGLFVIAATAIAAVGVTILGAGALFRKKVLVETYFVESVQGLAVGSPVKFRGVDIGKVEEITLTLKEYKTSHPYVLVRSGLFSGSLPETGPKLSLAYLPREVERGLRARLSFQGLTGAAYMEVDYLDGDKNPPLEIDWTPEHTYLPSARSTITRFTDAVDGILRNLEQVNLQKTIVNFEKALQVMTKTVQDANVEMIAKQTERLLTELGETNQAVSEFVKGAKTREFLDDAAATATTMRQIVEESRVPVAGALNKMAAASASATEVAQKLESVSESVPQVAQQLERTLKELQSLVSGQRQDVENTVQNLRVVSENLRDLTENLKRYPGQLLLGPPPKHSGAQSE